MVIPSFVGTEIEDFFFELFFGPQGGWIGFILIASIMLVVTVKVKYAGIMFSVASVFMGVMMAEEATFATDTNLWWTCIMYFVLPFFLILIMIKDQKGGF